MDLKSVRGSAWRFTAIRKQLPDRRHWVIRPDDLLVLDFELHNLRLRPGGAGGAAQLEKDGSGQALLTVIFPSQHLEEAVYFTNSEGYPVSNAYRLPPGAPGAGGAQDTNTRKDIDAGTGEEPLDDPPIQSFIAGWSRLVFEVPDSRLPLRWTLSDLLYAIGTLPLRVPANAPPAGDDLMQFRPHITELVGVATTSASDLLAAGRARRQLRVHAHAFGLTDLTGSATRGLIARTATKLESSALDLVMRRPSPRAPTATETSLELPREVFLSPNHRAAWIHAASPVRSTASGHTELWHTRLGVRGKELEAEEGSHPLRTLRAVWTTAGLPLTTPPFGTQIQTPGAGSSPRMAMDSFDKHNVVHLTSNFQLEDLDRPGRYFEPRPLDVNHLALSALGAWMDTRGVWDGTPPMGLSVEEWRHRATMGRDHYVRLVYRGFLFPWGHRASLIKISERRFEPGKPGNPAYLRQRMFIIVREPVREYPDPNQRYQGKYPQGAQGQRYDLMLPFVSARMTTMVSPLLDVPEDDIAGSGESCFWPFVSGQPFRFQVAATDVENNVVELSMPLIFVRNEHMTQVHASSIIPQVAADYATRLWPGSSARRSTVPLLGQRTAFARSASTDDTTFSAHTITFGGEVPEATVYDALSKLHPRFFPVIRETEINVPSMQAIAGTATPVSMVFAPRYLVDEFGSQNGGQVFLAANTEPFRVEFSKQSQRSGAILSPDLAISGMSRIAGPVAGDVNKASQGTFDPSSWFGPIASATLFGALKLEDILEVVGFDELDKLPRLTGQLLNPVEKLIADLARIRQHIAADAAAVGAAALTLLDQLTATATGSIPALLKGGPAAAVLSQLTALDAELATLSGALAGSNVAPGPKAALTVSIAALRSQITATLAAPGLLSQFAAGDDLPKAINARFEWRPLLRNTDIFIAGGPRNLLLAVEAAGESFNVTCSLDDFTIDIEVVTIKFQRVQFRSIAGGKPEVDVQLDSFALGGPLSFVQTLQELIPLDGFSDPPRVEVTAEGITAGYSVGLPNIAVGVFSLENLAISAGFAMPFIGKPMCAWFRFCERENPARLTVALFGGGFFFGVTVNADGLHVLEGAIEFGAAVSVDLGVAAGGVSIMAGLYFKIETGETTLAGYFRMRGMVRALGIVTVTLEVYLEMRYESGSGKCVGTATVSLEVEIAMFSVTVSVTCTKKFAGANADPTLSELLDVKPDATSQDWNAYCEAFA